MFVYDCSINIHPFPDSFQLIKSMFPLIISPIETDSLDFHAELID